MPWTPPATEPAPDAALTRAARLALGTPGRGGRLAGVFRSVESTQTIARAWALAGAPEGTLVVAEHQHRGRGRGQRPWLAPPGTALLVSCVLRPALPPARWPEIALAAGVAVAEAVQGLGGLAPRLKWPNDVFVEGRKVAGILAEGIVGGDPCLVLGIGVNLTQADADWPPELAGRAASLAALGAPVGRWPLLGACVDRLHAWCGVLETEGFEPLRVAWRGRGLLGTRLVTPAGTGVAEDLAPGGGLRLRRDDGTLVLVVAGETREAA